MRNASRWPVGQALNDEPARFCDAACRQAAWRRRKAGVAEAPQRRGGRSRGLAKGAQTAN
jgi:hypothetical protein